MQTTHARQVQHCTRVFERLAPLRVESVRRFTCAGDHQNGLNMGMQHSNHHLRPPPQHAVKVIAQTGL